MNYHQTVEKIANLMSQIHDQVPPEYLDESTTQLMTDLRTDISTVVIVGEFNRGKSTLVNALLGLDLLPCDVIPTTANIHVIRWAASPVLRLHCKTGGHTDKALQPEHLKQFVAGASSVAEVSYIEIGLNLPQLKGLVLVDTPGVGDMNQQRTEVTYSFVPRADVVLFMIDATTPVRRSEIDFLESAILATGLERLIFVANFADALDADERDGVLQAINNRLSSVLGKCEFKSVLFSAMNAGESVRTNDATLKATSGLTALLTEMEMIRLNGPATEARGRQFVSRAQAVCLKCDALLAAREQAFQYSDEKLLACIEVAKSNLAATEDVRLRLRDWAACRRDEILAIVGRSLDTFSSELASSLRNVIVEYAGLQLKDVVENRVPLMSRRQYKVWIETHAPSIRRTLMQLDSHLCAAVSEYCKHSVVSNAGKLSSLSVVDIGTEMDLCSADASSTPIKAGLLAAAASGMLILVGAPVLVPFIGMAGLPIISKLWTERNVREAKARAISDVDEAVRRSTSSFAKAVLSAVDQDVNTIVKSAEQQLGKNLAITKQQAENEAAERALERADRQRYQERILDARKGVAAVLAELQIMRVAPATRLQTEEDLVHA